MLTFDLGSRPQGHSLKGEHALAGLQPEVEASAIDAARILGKHRGILQNLLPHLRVVPCERT